MRFRDRTEAGKKLAEEVARHGFERPVVLGIPRGGLPVAAEVARATGGELAAIVARKLGAPGNPELAIGATTADGTYYLDATTARLVGADEAYIEAERARQAREAARREELFDSHRRPPLAGRVVIVVDDGIATGATAIASVRSVRAAGAARTVLAVPVGPPGTLERLREEADDVICLYADPDFWAVGQYYDEFEQVSDGEVQAILRSFTPVGADPSRDFRVASGAVELAGRLVTPGGAGPFAVVIFVHGLGSGKDSPRNVVIAEALADEGIASVLFDLRGHGESGGTRPDGIAPYVEDVAAVYQWTQRQPEVDPARIALAGSSLGAVIAMHAAALGRVRPRTMVLRAPPAEPEDFARLSVPSLLLVGSLDPLLSGVSEGARRAPAATVSVVPGAGHLFEEEGALEEATRRSVAWLTKTLLGREPASLPGGGSGRR
jgi:putative phosphoribosyl transferase